MLLRNQGIPVYSMIMGDSVPLPDLSVEIDSIPTLVEVNEPFEVVGRVFSSFSETISTEITLKNEGDIIEQKKIELERGETLPISFRTEFTEAGYYNLSVEVAPVEGELTLDNNQKEFNIQARENKIKVLLVDTTPRWEYRFIRNAMMRDPLTEVSCLLLHPGLNAGGGPTYIKRFPEREELSAYDVVLLGDIGLEDGQLDEVIVQNLIDHTRNEAGGLILMPGRLGNQKSLWTHPDFSALYPVKVEDPSDEYQRIPSRLTLTDQGKDSLLLSLNPTYEVNERIWKNLPGFTWYQPASGVKVGAQTLAYHPEERTAEGAVPIMVTSNAGLGKVLYMGIDSSWKWRKGVEDLYHYRFWRQMSRWMSYQRTLTDGSRAKLFLGVNTPNVGDPIPFRLRASKSDAQPAELSQVRVVVKSSSERETLVSISQSKEWGEFLGKVSFSEAGMNSIEVIIDDEVVASREIMVKESPKEVVGELINSSLLKEVSLITGGEALPYSERKQLLSQLLKASKPSPKYSLNALYHNWPWYVGLMGLLTVSWLFKRAHNS